MFDPTPRHLKQIPFSICLYFGIFPEPLQRSHVTLTGLLIA
jgi:hypothetical protein